MTSPSAAPFGVFYDSLDLTNVRSQNVEPRILLFGGSLSQDPNTGDLSCRDAFYNALRKNSHDILNHVLLAETIFDFYKDSTYTDLLTFELDLAELSTATVIIPESFGSVAELGSFSVLKAFRNQLLVATRQSTDLEKSFTHNGPILYLQNKKSDIVKFYDWSVSEGNYTPESFSNYSELADEISKISQANSKGRNLKDSKHGILLYSILGFLKVALLVRPNEMLDFAKYIFDKIPENTPTKTKKNKHDNITRDELHRKLQLLEHLKFIKTIQHGNYSYYVLTNDSVEFTKFSYTEKAIIKNTEDWINYFIEIYNKSDLSKIRTWQKYLRETYREDSNE